MKSITYWLKSTQSIDYNKRLKIEKSNIIQILANTVKPFNSRFQNVIRFKSLNEWFINSLIQLFGFKDSYLSFRWQQMHVKCQYQLIYLINKHQPIIIVHLYIGNISESPK